MNFIDVVYAASMGEEGETEAMNSNNVEGADGARSAQDLVRRLSRRALGLRLVGCGCRGRLPGALAARQQGLGRHRVVQAGSGRCARGAGARSGRAGNVLAGLLGERCEGKGRREKRRLRERRSGSVIQSSEQRETTEKEDVQAYVGPIRKGEEVMGA